MKFVKKTEDIMREDLNDLPELDLNDLKRLKLKNKTLDKLNQHLKIVKSLTEKGLKNRKISKKSWVKIKISRTSSKQKNFKVVKDATPGKSRETQEEDEVVEKSNEINEDEKIGNIQ